MKKPFTRDLWPRLRLAGQIIFFSLLVYIIWVTKYPLQGFINPLVFFRLDPLVMLLTSLAERLWLPGLVISILTLAVTLVLGRVFCGWFCPMGTLLDAISWLTRRWRRPEAAPTAWLQSKLVLLGILVLLALSGIQSAWLLDPLAIFVRTFSFGINPWINGGADQAFAWLLPQTHFWPPLEATYDWLRSSVLDISNPHFPHSAIILWMFAAIAALSLIRRRFWCRHLCPLGALLGLAARFSWLKREAPACAKPCGVCQNVCRTNAIAPDNSTLQSECIMCLDCVEHCPTGKSRFVFFPKRTPASKAAAMPKGSGGISRAQFLALAAGSVLLTAGRASKPVLSSRQVIRPPAALPEQEFVERCVRCGNCMKVCLTNGLQPTGLESGWSGIWTPRLVPEIGYCEYQCTLCGQVCPTNAIRPVSAEQKKQTKLGLAVVNRNICFPWAQGQECLVCEEHCPIPTKAIKSDLLRTHGGRVIGRPVVDPLLCVGCSICQSKCPARPRAITVQPL